MPDKPIQTNTFREMLTDQPTAKLIVTDTDLYTRFLHNNPHYAIILLDADGRITDCNLGAERIYGFAPGTMVGSAWSAVYSECDLKLGQPKLSLAQAAESGHGQEEGWHITQSGKKIWVSLVITPLYDGTNQISGYGLVATDMTSKHLAEQKLRSAYQQLEETAKEVMKLNSEMRELHLRMTGREYLIRDLENENKLLKLRLEIDCDYRQPEVQD